MFGNTDNTAITQAMLDNAGRIDILSGEGTHGTEERPAPALFARCALA